MKIPANVVDQLVQGAQSDIRQVLNMLSTWRLSSASMDFDEGKAMCVFPLISCALRGIQVRLPQGQDEREIRSHDTVRCTQQDAGPSDVLA